MKLSHNGPWYKLGSTAYTYYLPVSRGLWIRPVWSNGQQIATLFIRIS